MLTRVLPRVRLTDVAVAVVAGLGIGALTFLGEGVLLGPLYPFVNSVAAWLVAPYLVGSRGRSRPAAALLGCATCLLELVGYTLAGSLHGIPVDDTIFLFWSVCAVAGGPVFGLAGWVARSGPARVRGLGPATLSALFLAEGGWLYLHELRADVDGALWLTIGGAIAVGGLRGRREWRWLPVTVALGLLGEIVFTHSLPALLA